MSESEIPASASQSQSHAPADPALPVAVSEWRILKEIPPELRREIPQEILEILDKLKPILVREERTHTEFSLTRVAPLPLPSELAAYNDVIPQGADRIMKMAEAQSAHRIDIEKKVVSSQQGQESRGQILGFVIAIVGLIAGAYVAVSGQPWAGAAIGGVPLVGLVSVFVLSKNQEKSELADKRKQMDAVNATPPPAPPAPADPIPPRPSGGE